MSSSSFTFDFFPGDASASVDKTAHAALPPSSASSPAAAAAASSVACFAPPADAAARAQARGSCAWAAAPGVSLRRLRPAPGSGAGALVVAGAYEGGADVWECTADVPGWLEAQAQAGGPAGARLRPAGRTVLDLGCGAALLAAWAAARGAARVVCQDLNADVLADVAAPTLAANGAGAGAACAAVTLLAGAWHELAAALSEGGPGGAGDWRALIGGGACGIIVASEILYREAAYADLTSILARCLAPTGVAVIGTKRLYFGAALGGGSAAFAAHVRASGCGLRARVVHSIEDGRSMTRDILLIEWER